MMPMTAATVNGNRDLILSVLLSPKISIIGSAGRDVC
jgi:hypothetical protein